mgnify:CR=1 FL=1
MIEKRIVLAHAFRKKSSALDVSDIQIAERRMNNFLARIHDGKIRLMGCDDEKA